MVYDLFLEMNALFRLIHQGLEGAEAGIQVHSGKGYLLPRARQHVTVADRYVRSDMGLLAMFGGTVRTETDEVDEEDDADDDAGDEEEEVDRAVVAVSEDTRLLGVRAVLHDRSVRDPTQFRPTVIAAVFDDVRRYKNSQPAVTENAFSLKRANLKRLVKQLRPATTSDAIVRSRIPRFYVSARVARVHEVPLAGLRTETDVQQLIDRMVEIVESARA